MCTPHSSGVISHYKRQPTSLLPLPRHTDAHVLANADEHRTLYSYLILFSFFCCGIMCCVIRQSEDLVKICVSRGWMTPPKGWMTAPKVAQSHKRMHPHLPTHPLSNSSIHPSIQVSSCPSAYSFQPAFLPTCIACYYDIINRLVS